MRRGPQIDGGGINSEFGAAVGGPIIQDKLGFRASVWTQHDGGFVDQNPALLGQPPANSVPRGQVAGDLLPGIVGGQTGTNINKGETYSARVALLWKPIDAFAVEPSIYYQKRDQNSADLFDPTIGNPSKGKFRLFAHPDSADQRYLLYAVTEARIRHGLGPGHQPDEQPAS